MLDTMCSYHTVTLNETVNKIYHSHFSILLNLPNELCLVINSQVFYQQEKDME